MSAQNFQLALASDSLGDSPPAVSSPSYGLGDTWDSCSCWACASVLVVSAIRRTFGICLRTFSTNCLADAKLPDMKIAFTPCVFHFSMKLSSCDWACVVSPPLLIDKIAVDP